ncbi:hypothetical protein C479_04027 [Halovivax asiaticus JCM 14624]|uniref:DUF429 domain-containing protein n=1 Tax=Halovivax asiaticus JCM 14624 TaxID=1227490 RepID=M0BR11_9EURY|nr:DUF429 domain-containing protein [Halovivax asiaticus]ELZ12532.1 hypothetical protein C479_04027 [Halovivax asiaticus JCM 14624]
MYAGVDGCSGGWIAISYTDEVYRGTNFYEKIEALWAEHDNVERILVDVPIGLRERTGARDPVMLPCESS